MKNTNALQIFSILSVIVIIILVVVIVMFNNAWDEHDSKMKDAVARADAAKKSEEEARMENLDLRKWIGHDDQVALQVMEESYNKDIEQYTKGSARNYRNALANIWNELSRKNEEHKTTQEALLELQANYDNLSALYETIREKYSQERDRAVADLGDARKEFEGNLDTTRKEIAVIKADADKSVQNAEERAKAAETRADEKQVEANITKNRNDELGKVIDDLTRTHFDVPDGKILSVNQQTGLVIVNLGSEDGLMTRMMFSVYDPSITGISFGADQEHQGVICEVCKRDASLNASKASIEIIKILGPHRAEARILDDQLTNPILADDVIHTPIWKPGQRQRFALASGMRIPGLGRRDGGANQTNLEEIKRLISVGGGIVDSYISDGNDGHQRGEIVGNITPNTTYVVIGDLDDQDQQDQEMMEAQSKMIKDAGQLSVRQITLRELLNRMQWKNVTPVRGFGPYAIESDHRIEPTGERSPSTGRVSQVYDLPNDRARLSPMDRSARPSTGRVADIYMDRRTTTQSTGNVSELFRTRNPSATRTELSE